MLKRVIAALLIFQCFIVSPVLAPARAEVEIENAPVSETLVKDLLFSDPEAAFSILKNLHEERSGDPEFDLYYAYADYQTNIKKSRQANRLYNAIKAYDRVGGAQTYEFGRILSSYAEWQLAKKQTRFARSTAKRAEEILVNARPADSAARASAILWIGVSYLQEDPMFDSHLEAAYEEFTRARTLFPNCCDGTEYPDSFLAAVAWQAAAAGMLASRNPRSASLAGMASAFVVPESAVDMASCDGALKGEISKKVRNGPTWAAHLFGRYKEGYVLSVDFSIDSEPAEWRVLSEAFGPYDFERKKVHFRFRDKAIAKAMNRWRAREGVSEACRINRILVLGGYASINNANYPNTEGLMDDTFY